MERKKIIVVEDEPDLVDVVTYNLQREGYSVLTAQRGDEGLNLIRSEGPDLVLLDEPTAGLSFEETKKTGEIIKYLNKQGTTFLIVEHDMEILKQIATTVSVLHLGAMFVEGTPESVLKNKDVAKIYLGVS